MVNYIYNYNTPYKYKKDYICIIRINIFIDSCNLNCKLLFRANTMILKIYTIENKLKNEYSTSEKKKKIGIKIITYYTYIYTEYVRIETNIQIKMININIL